MEQTAFMTNESMKSVLRRMEVIHPSSEKENVSREFLALVALGFIHPDQLPVEELKNFPKEMTVAYLRYTHKYYLDTLVPEIEVHFVEAIRNSGMLSLDLIGIYNQFNTYRKELVKHIRFEEEKLFPQLLSQETPGKCLHHSILHAAHHQHEDQLAKILEKIISLADHYKDLMSFRMLIEKMKTLDKDLIVHARIEDEVLL